MKNLSILIASIFCLMTTNITAQENFSKNYIISNYSYSFFGTGDISGTAIGISYNRMLSDKFGFNLGVSKANGHGQGILNLPEEFVIKDVNLVGSGHAFEAALYNSLNLGLTYKAADGEKHALLCGAGLNYKSIKYNYVNGTLTTTTDDGINEVTILGTEYNSEKEVGFFISLDYLIFITEGFALGIHGCFENTSNVLTNAGVSLGYRF